MTANEYIRYVKNKNWRPFTTRFRQRDYYEHIIRGEDDLARIREYIVNNPANWGSDEYYTKPKK